MFPEGQKVRTFKYSTNDLFECSDPNICPKGLIDYKCQYKNSCYLNLVELTATLIGFSIGLIFFFIVFAKVTHLLYKVFKGVFFVTKFMTFMASLIKFFSLGVLGDDIVYEKPKKSD